MIIFPALAKNKVFEHQKMIFGVNMVSLAIKQLNKMSRVQIPLGRQGLLAQPSSKIQVYDELLDERNEQ